MQRCASFRLQQRPYGSVGEGDHMRFQNPPWVQPIKVPTALNLIALGQTSVKNAILSEGVRITSVRKLLLDG